MLEPSRFTPNWKLNGFATKEEGMIKAIGDLMSASSTKGLGGDSVITWNKTIFKIGLGKKKT